MLLFLFLLLIWMAIGSLVHIVAKTPHPAVGKEGDIKAWAKGLYMQLLWPYYINLQKEDK